MTVLHLVNMQIFPLVHCSSWFCQKFWNIQFEAFNIFVLLLNPVSLTSLRELKVHPGFNNTWLHRVSCVRKLLISWHNHTHFISPGQYKKKTNENKNISNAVFWSSTAAAVSNANFCLVCIHTAFLVVMVTDGCFSPLPRFWRYCSQELYFIYQMRCMTAVHWFSSRHFLNSRRRDLQQISTVFPSKSVGFLR